MELTTIFEAVAKHLIMQNAKAMARADGQPIKLMYRTPEGLSDSIGCLIAPSRYDPLMEGYAFKGMSTWKQWSNDDGLKKLRAALIAQGVDVDDEPTMRLLTDLQHVHDNHEPEFWADRLRAVARTWRIGDGMVTLALRLRTREELTRAGRLL